MYSTELQHVICCYLLISVQYVCLIPPCNQWADDGSVSTGRCASVVSKFLELDLEKDDVSAFLKDYVLPTTEGIL